MYGFYKSRRIPLLDAMMAERKTYHNEFKNKNFVVDEFTPDFAIDERKSNNK